MKHVRVLELSASFAPIATLVVGAGGPAANEWVMSPEREADEKRCDSLFSMR